MDGFVCNGVKAILRCVSIDLKDTANGSIPSIDIRVELC